MIFNRGRLTARVHPCPGHDFSKRAKKPLQRQNTKFAMSLSANFDLTLGT
jgi:hypothetical protein